MRNVPSRRTSASQWLSTDYPWVESNRVWCSGLYSFCAQAFHAPCLLTWRRLPWPLVLLPSCVTANGEWLWPLQIQQLPEGTAGLFSVTSFIPGANSGPILYIGLNCCKSLKDTFTHGRETNIFFNTLPLSRSLPLSFSAYLLHLLWKTKTKWKSESDSQPVVSESLWPHRL